MEKPMALALVTVLCLSDNYAFLIHNDETNETTLVDAPEAAPIIAALDTHGWHLNTILLTHHHYDHIDGVDALRAKYNCAVIGAAADAHRLPPLDTQVNDGEVITVAGHSCAIFDVSGHTVGHIAFHFPDAKMLFTADSLMAMGCGRLFEGSPMQMWQSLSKLMVLPPDTLVCSGHEYTASNAKFAQTVDPDNPALKARVKDIADKRQAGEPTVPSLLSLELETNPFLRATDPGIRTGLQMEKAPDWEVFAEIRRLKDAF
jgi:hydroxyacylglutathione hydrolase